MWLFCCITRLERSSCDAAKVDPLSTCFLSLLSSSLSLSLSLSLQLYFLTLFVPVTPLHPLIPVFNIIPSSCEEAVGKMSEQSCLLLIYAHYISLHVVGSNYKDASRFTICSFQLDRSGYEAEDSATLNLLPVSLPLSSPSLLEYDFSQCSSP